MCNYSQMVLDNIIDEGRENGYWKLILNCKILESS